MGEVHPIRTPPPRCWEPSKTDDIRKLPAPFLFPADRMLNCNHEGLHIDRLTDLQLLADLWPWMREGLLFIKHKNNPKAHWLPEHVRLEIIKGLPMLAYSALGMVVPGQSAAECFLAHDPKDQSVHGFLVAVPLTDVYVQLPLVWFQWMSCMDHGVFDRLLPQFEELRRARGYRSWRLATSRKGYARRAERIGARVVEYLIEKEGP